MHPTFDSIFDSPDFSCDDAAFFNWAWRSVLHCIVSLSSSRSGSRSRPFSSLVGYVAPRLSATTLRRIRGHSATVSSWAFRHYSQEVLGAFRHCRWPGGCRGRRRSVWSSWSAAGRRRVVGSLPSSLHLEGILPVGLVGGLVGVVGGHLVPVSPLPFPFPFHPFVGVHVSSFL